MVINLKKKLQIFFCEDNDHCNEEKLHKKFKKKTLQQITGKSN